MENLPDSLVSEILRRIDKTSDRNAFSMVLSRPCSIEADQRDFLGVGCGLHPGTEINFSVHLISKLNKNRDSLLPSWTSKMGKQLNSQDLITLSSHCPKLVDRTLSFCSFSDDTGLGYLALRTSLKYLKLSFLLGMSSKGLLSVVTGCKSLSSIYLNQCIKMSSVEWLDHVGKHGNL